MTKSFLIVFPILLFTIFGCSENNNIVAGNAINQNTTPVEVVKIFFNAYASGDGNTLVNCMAEEAIAEVNDYVQILKETPDSSLEYLNSIGVIISAGEIENLTAGNFVTILFNSPVYATELPDFNGAEFGEATIVSDKAIVPVTIDNRTDPIELVKENDQWRITGTDIGIL